MINKNNQTYKTISEVAELLNLINTKTGKVSTHTIRFWEKEFKQIKPKIFAGKRRYYDEETIEILKNIKERYEEHHNVLYSDEAIKACVTLTDRYISERHLPDKAIDA